LTGDELAEISNLPRTALSERWKGLFGTDPPPRTSRAMMSRLVLSEVQWRASGQSRAALIRRLKKVADGANSSKPLAAAGNRLVRDWNGRRHVVEVTDKGYVWNGRAFRSLSAIAREITGARWSGPRFFGVVG
jgi:hypothetical protein